MNRRGTLYFVSMLAVAAGISGCGGAGSNPPPPPAAIAVSMSPQPPASIDAGKTTNLTAVVSNDSANGGVKWSVTCSGTQCGSFSASTTSSGAATVYTAPASVPTPASVTITASSVTDSTRSAIATVTISAPTAPIAVSLNPAPPASLAGGVSANLTAVVANDSANAGVTWAVTCGSAQCGSFSPSATPSGTATSYTAPATPPTPATVTVTATSVSDTTKSASASISITAPPPVLADGSYVYHFAGEDGNGPYFVAGAFTVHSGVISGGEQDLMDGSSSNDTIVASGSSLSLANGNIQIVLNTQNPNLGTNGIETLRGTQVSEQRLLITQFDTFGSGSGSLDLQTSTTAPTGGYAFTLGGQDGAAQPAVLAIGGVLRINSGAIDINNSVFDYNDGLESIGQGKTFASGTVTAPDSFGRVTLTLNTAVGSGLPGFNLAGYIVGTNRIELVETQNDPLNGDVGGAALGQGSYTGTFNQSSVAGSTYAFAASGGDVYGLANYGGGFGFNADGTMGGVIALNDIKNFGALQVSGGTYTVDPTGRVTISNLSFSNSDAVFSFQLYIDGNNNALEIGVDQSQVTFGASYAQTAGSDDYEGNFALAAQGFATVENAPFWSAAGPVTVSSGNISGFTDYSVQNAQNTASIPTPGVPVGGTEDTTQGTFNISGLNVASQSMSDGFGYYPIDDQRVLAIEVDGQQLGMLVMEEVQQPQQ
jgi:hypothetical protein